MRESRQITRLSPPIPSHTALGGSHNCDQTPGPAKMPIAFSRRGMQEEEETSLADAGHRCGFTNRLGKPVITFPLTDLERLTDTETNTLLYACSDATTFNNTTS